MLIRPSDVPWMNKVVKQQIRKRKSQTFKAWFRLAKQLTQKQKICTNTNSF